MSGEARLDPAALLGHLDRHRVAALEQARARFRAGERPPALDAHPGWGDLRR